MWRDRRGGVSIMGGVAGALACALAALTIDLGSIALHARRVQQAADLAALAAARDLSDAQAAGEATARHNLAGPVWTRIEVGAYAADPSLPPEDRFTPGAADANAARATVRADTPLYFGRWIVGRAAVSVTRGARAARVGGEPLAAFSVGSRLARLDEGLANQLLSVLTGSRISLSIVDYRALAEARVDLLGFSRALATEAGVGVGRFDQLAEAEVDVALLNRVLARQVGGPAGEALARALPRDTGRVLRLGDLLSLSSDGLASGLERLEVGVSALDLLFAALETANGERQLGLDAGARAGLAGADVWLAIGERPNRSPWLAVTPDGRPVLSTAQARLHVRARTAARLSGLAQVDLPVLVEVAPAQARLEAVRCGAAPSVVVAARPGVARAWIAEADRARLADFRTPLAPRRAALVSVAGLATVTGQADAEAADALWRPIEFDQADIAEGRTRAAASRAFASGLTSSLLQRLDLDVRVIGLGLGLGDLTRALSALLTPLGPVLDELIGSVLDLLGLRLGEADVTVHGVRCPAAGGASAVLVG